MTNLTKALLGITGLNAVIGITNMVMYFKTKKRHDKYFGTLTKMYMELEDLIIKED